MKDLEIDLVQYKRADKKTRGLLGLGHDTQNAMWSLNWQPGVNVEFISAALVSSHFA